MAFSARWRWLVRSARLASVAGVVLIAGNASAATFTRGFVDDVWIYPNNPAQTTVQWARNVHASGARIAEVEVDWTGYETHAPAVGTNAANPANAAYGNWSDLDTVVRTLAKAGVQPMFMVTDEPRWAEASSSAAALTQAYVPNDKAFRAFMKALATRYDGHYADPLNPGHALPRVRYYQDWAEANLSIKLGPQWTRSHGTWVNTGAAIYRGMLNAFYAGVKSAVASDVVIFSGLESYGDPPGTRLGRVAPVTFLENVLCLNAKLQKVCNDPVHFDVMASDPYEVGSPTTPAVNTNDASAPDLAKLTKVVNAGLRLRTVLPARAKPLWVTEFSYDSNPPNPKGGLPLLKQAHWLEQSFYVFWKEGVSTVLWYLIRDQPGKAYATTYYSGIYFYNGKRKPSYTAYSFPLVVAADGTHAQIWGVAPRRGAVAVQQRHGSRWRTVSTFHPAAGGVFSAVIPAPTRGSSFRAIELHRSHARGAINASLPWTY